MRVDATSLLAAFFYIVWIILGVIWIAEKI